MCSPRSPRTDKVMDGSLVVAPCSKVRVPEKSPGEAPNKGATQLQ